jgi:hypothetical protein
VDKWKTPYTSLLEMEAAKEWETFFVNLVLVEAKEAGEEENCDRVS